jgi:hypothetical protein
MNMIKLICLVLLILTMPMTSDAAGEKEESKSNASASSNLNLRPSYVPPLRGAPAGRVGGGTRGITENQTCTIQVMAPDHAGYTTQDQPCLYWYVSGGLNFPIEMTVTRKDAVQPLVEKQLPGPVEDGLHTFCLADHDVRLSPDVSYKWFVTLIPDTENRSKDILAGGIIEKIKVSKSLDEKLEAADGSTKVRAYAEEGLWYDSFDSAMKTLDKTPDDQTALMQRNSLLEQVGLKEISEQMKK